MKLLTLLCVLLFTIPLFGQDYETYSTQDLFGRSGVTFGVSTNSTDSVYIDSINTGYMPVLHTQRDTNNTITSRPIDHEGTNDLTVSAQMDSVEGDVMTTYLYFGMYVSPSYGWRYELMDSLVADADTFSWDLGRQNYGPYLNFTLWSIRIVEQDDSTASKITVDVTNLKTN